MSITGGGGFGPKGPGASGVKTGAKPGVSMRASERRKAVEAEVKAEAEQAPREDSFEIGAKQRLLGRDTGSLLPVDGSSEVSDIFPTIDRVSQATNVVAAFEERNRVLTRQFEAFRQQAQDLVDDVARAGFAPDAVKATRHDLDALREQMAQVRERILRNNRRIKLLQSSVYNLPRYDVGRLRRQTGKVSGAAGGVGGGIGAISMAGDVVQHGLSRTQGVTRLPLGGGASIDRHALGTYLSQIGPTSMLSRFAVSLVEAGRRFQVRVPVSAELRPLHADVAAGRAGRDLEELAHYAELGSRGKL